MCEHVKRIVSCVLLIGLTGCYEFTTYHDARGAFGADGRLMLGRRFAVIHPTPLPLAKIHYGFPVIFGDDFNSDWSQKVTLEPGTIVRTDYLQEVEYEMGVIWGLIDAGSHRDLSAVVTNGEHRATRVGIRYEFGGIPWIDSPPFTGVYDFVPLPDDAPAWLDMTVLPPAERPGVSTVDLANAVHDPDWAARFYAVRALARRTTTDPQAISPLELELNDELSNTRLAALEALLSAGKLRPECLDVIVSRFFNDGRVCSTPFGDEEKLESALVAMDARVDAKLIHLIKSAEQGWGEEEKLLRRIGPRAVPTLLAAVDDRGHSGPIMETIDSIIADSSSKLDPQLLDQVVATDIKALDNIELPVRILAARNLRTIGLPHAATAIPALQRHCAGLALTSDVEQFHDEAKKTLAAFQKQ